MKVYQSTIKAQKQPSHMLTVCPANDPQGMEGHEAPSEWFNPNPEGGKPIPRQIPVHFRYGEADVPANLGAYLLRRGLAAKTKLILPT